MIVNDIYNLRPKNLGVVQEPRLVAVAHAPMAIRYRNRRPFPEENWIDRFIFSKTMYCLTEVSVFSKKSPLEITGFLILAFCQG